jgi:polysaccharide biosynthesis protein PslH
MHEVTFVGIVADQTQIQGSKCSDLYSSYAVWVDEPKASLNPSRLSFIVGAFINLASDFPYAVERFRSDSLRRKITELLKSKDFDVLICDFLFPAASLPWEFKDGAPTPWVIFQHNVESMIWKRRADKRCGLPGFYLRSQWKRMLNFENNICQKFDAVLSVSEDDASIMRQTMGLPNVLGSIPTGVDIEYFQAIPKSLALQPTVIFMGSMDWYANAEGVEWFVEKVWPLIRDHVSEARFLIVGRQPTPSISALASQTSGIEVTGTVPDVRPHLRSAHVMVVPLRIGGGTRLKIFEAMAAEVPVVSTTIGAEGLEVVHGRHALIADDAKSFADAVVSLLCRVDLRTNIINSALTEVAEPNSWDAAAKTMEKYLLQLRNHKPATSPASE